MGNGYNYSYICTEELEIPGKKSWVNVICRTLPRVSGLEPLPFLTPSGFGEIQLEIQKPFLCTSDFSEWYSKILGRGGVEPTTDKTLTTTGIL